MATDVQQTLDYLAAVRERLNAEEFEERVLGRKDRDLDVMVPRLLARARITYVRMMLEHEPEELSALEQLRVRDDLDELFAQYPLEEMVLGG